MENSNSRELKTKKMKKCVCVFKKNIFVFLFYERSTEFSEFYTKP